MKFENRIDWTFQIIRTYFDPLDIVPIPSCATFKPDNEPDDEDSVSWKSSSSSYLTSSGDENDEKIATKTQLENKIDFSKVLGNFNGNFKKEQNFGVISESDNLAPDSKWDSDTETDLTGSRSFMIAIKMV